MYGCLLYNNTKELYQSFRKTLLYSNKLISLPPFLGTGRAYPSKRVATPTCGCVNQQLNFIVGSMSMTRHTDIHYTYVHTNIYIYMHFSHTHTHTHTHTDTHARALTYSHSVICIIANEIQKNSMFKTNFTEFRNTGNLMFSHGLPSIYLANCI